MVSLLRSFNSKTESPKRSGFSVRPKPKGLISPRTSKLIDNARKRAEDRRKASEAKAKADKLRADRLRREAEAKARAVKLRREQEQAEAERKRREAADKAEAAAKEAKRAAEAVNKSKIVKSDNKNTMVSRFSRMTDAKKRAYIDEEIAHEEQLLKNNSAYRAKVTAKKEADILAAKKRAAEKAAKEAAAKAERERVRQAEIARQAKILADKQKAEAAAKAKAAALKEQQAKEAAAVKAAQAKAAEEEAKRLAQQEAMAAANIASQSLMAGLIGNEAVITPKDEQKKRMDIMQIVLIGVSAIAAVGVIIFKIVKRR